MRAASPDAHIYPIDPEDKPICGQPIRWIDSAAGQNKSTYYTGSNFQDLRHVMAEDNYKVGEGATDEDKAGWTPKQMFARQDADAQFLWHSLDSYAEFPPLVSPILSSGRGGERKAHHLHHSDRNHDIVSPLLRPETVEEDRAIYERICQRLGLDPKMMDNESYGQILTYNQIAYMEVRPGSPRLFSIRQK